MSTVRVIQRPNGRNCTLGEYVRSWRILRGLPPRTLVANWDYEPVRASEILAKISYGVHDRINRHLPWPRKGRNWDPCYSGWARFGCDHLPLP